MQSNAAIPLRWVTLAKTTDVPEGQAVLVRHERAEILIFHRPEGWTAFDNTCPHAGAPLYPQHFDGECVTCMYHGLRFRAADGSCPDARGWTLDPYPLRLEGDEIQIGFPAL